MAGDVVELVSMLTFAFRASAACVFQAIPGFLARTLVVRHAEGVLKAARRFEGSEGVRRGACGGESQQRFGSSVEYIGRNLKSA